MKFIKCTAKEKRGPIPRHSLTLFKLFPHSLSSSTLWSCSSKRYSCTYSICATYFFFVNSNLQRVPTICKRPTSPMVRGIPLLIRTIQPDQFTIPKWCAWQWWVSVKILRKVQYFIFKTTGLTVTCDMEIAQKSADEERGKKRCPFALTSQTKREVQPPDCWIVQFRLLRKHFKWLLLFPLILQVNFKL